MTPDIQLHVHPVCPFLLQHNVFDSKGDMAGPKSTRDVLPAAIPRANPLLETGPRRTPCHAVRLESTTMLAEHARPGR